jgi:diguanylate cyclase (GGDEF)-like protein
VKEIIGHALTFAEEFNRIYFEERNVGSILGKLDPDIVWIDADQPEIFKGLAAVRQGLEAVAEEFRIPFSLDAQNHEASLLPGDTALVWGMLQIRRSPHDPEPEAFSVRYSYGIRRSNEELRIFHLHFSRQEQRSAAPARQNNKDWGNEARFRIALEASNDLVFEWDMDHDQITVEREAFNRLFQSHLDEKQALDPLPEIMKMIHPEDVTAVQDLLRPGSLKGKYPEEANAFTRDFRIQGGRSHSIWIRGTMIPIQDRSGRVSRAIGILKNVDKNKRLALEMQRKSQQDAVTGIFNRGYTEYAVNQYFFEAGKSANAALMMIDVDDFKQVNDTFGHLYGDRVLREITRKMADLFKGQTILGRIGGDEFVVFVENPLSMEWIEDKAWILIEKFAEAFAGQHPQVKTSCSIGISFAPLHGSDFQALLDKADAAMYQAKRNGKNCYCIWNELQTN